MPYIALQGTLTPVVAGPVRGAPSRKRAEGDLRPRLACHRAQSWAVYRWCQHEAGRGRSALRPDGTRTPAGECRPHGSDWSCAPSMLAVTSSTFGVVRQVIFREEVSTLPGELDLDALESIAREAGA